jgi:vacuolar protein sorting-associated protein 26
MLQIMDGSPSRGETIPIRLFLGGFDLTPTFREVNKRFSTRYYLSLVLIDEGGSSHVHGTFANHLRCAALL